MKKVLIGLFAVIAISFISCEENEAFEDNPIFDENATGDDPRLPGQGGGGTIDTTGGGGSGGGVPGLGLTLVDTAKSKRVAVLEDFTGVKCQFCPDGTRRAETIKQQYGDDFIIIATHGGGFAAPGGGALYPSGDTIFFPDFRTIFADQLIAQAGINSYPAGTMNRLDVNNDFNLTSNISPPLGMGRGNWANTAAAVRTMDAPVNVGAKATVDASRNLTVDVELYYTETEVDKNSINVAILQDGLMGLQIDIVGGAVVRDSAYIHNDMLRHYITGQWGEEITDTTTVGSVVKATYNYTIPDKFVNDPINNRRGEGDAIIDDLKVVVFVTRDRVNILNAVLVDIQ
ncbi:MAG: hypothetical protein CMP59_12430 [Flavobacteriales bacterium]|nr:hypothetical protein [Flavobacteriales bacterium]